MLDNLQSIKRIEQVYLKPINKDPAVRIRKTIEGFKIFSGGANFSGKLQLSGKSVITGAENISGGSGILSGIKDTNLIFKSLKAGKDLSIVGNDTSLTINFTGTSSSTPTNLENVVYTTGIQDINGIKKKFIETSNENINAVVIKVNYTVTTGTFQSNDFVTLEL